ncbi:hypothetical protein [Microbacterium sp. RURRCA19A]|uniref:hypothetical protein n=1 Tax=Microbacterium sp. RURRCA19A TaxID=1907391 RepID=UPI000970A345|nr:hypothetical protein [Microbacterium sp. RURRCA19A]
MPERELAQFEPQRPALRVVGVDEVAPVAPIVEELLPDLSVDAVSEIPLMRSGWAAVIEIDLKDDPRKHHQGWLRHLMLHSQHRTTVPKVTSEKLRVDLQVEDDSAETYQRVGAFALGLTAIVPVETGSVAIRINRLNDAVVEGILAGAPAGLHLAR